MVPALGVIVASGTSNRRNLVAFALACALAVPAALSEAVSGTSEWFVLLYLCLGAVVARVSLRDKRRSRSALEKEGSHRPLNEAPERYFRDAYDPVMYSGAIGLYSRIVHRLMERGAANDSDSVILELGAGAGQHARYVQTRYRAYYETDIAVPPSTSSPNPRTDSGLIRRHADAQNLSEFPDKSVDRIIATCLLAHLANPEEALEEWRRVIDPGGAVTIYVAAEPGMLLRLLRKYFVVPKARRLGQDHLAIIYRDHRNHYPAMRTMIESVFREDRVRRLRVPPGFLGMEPAPLRCLLHHAVARFSVVHQCDGGIE